MPLLPIEGFFSGPGIPYFAPSTFSWPFSALSLGPPAAPRLGFMFFLNFFPKIWRTSLGSQLASVRAAETLLDPLKLIFSKATGATDRHCLA